MNETKGGNRVDSLRSVEFGTSVGYVGVVIGENTLYAWACTWNLKGDVLSCNGHENTGSISPNFDLELPK